MTARAFLVRGLLCGLLAGFATFATAYLVGEPHVQTAIELEEAAPAAAPAAAAPTTATTVSTVAVHTHPADTDVRAHGGDDEGTTVSRHDQRTWGLLTGSLGIGTALGGLVALVSAAAVGRIGSLRAGQTTALVALVGWVAIALVPFLKYPANPPAVGDGETIGARTGLYFGLVAISVLVAVASVLLARRVHASSGTYAAVVAGVATYVVAMVVVGQVLPSIDEVGDFPGSTLWYFRRASLITTATMWAVIGVLLTGAVGRLAQQHSARDARRELAASL